MTDRSTEKLVVFAVLGFLHALKEGKFHPHEVFRVFGQPAVLSEMSAAGVRDEIIDLVNGLDELEIIAEFSGEEAWNEVVAQEIETCGLLLAALGAPDPNSEKPLMHLFSSPTNEKRLRDSISQLDAGLGVERNLIEP
jgi:hypothetical protein